MDTSTLASNSNAFAFEKSLECLFEPIQMIPNSSSFFPAPNFLSSYFLSSAPLSSLALPKKQRKPRTRGLRLSRGANLNLKLSSSDNEDPSPVGSILAQTYNKTVNRLLYVLTEEDIRLGLSHSPGTIKPFVCRGCSRRWKGREGFLTHLSTCPKPFVYSPNTPLRTFHSRSSRLSHSSSSLPTKPSPRKSKLHYCSSTPLLTQALTNDPPCSLNLVNLTHPKDAFHYCPPPTPSSPSTISHSIESSPAFPPSFQSTPSFPMSPLLSPAIAYHPSSTSLPHFSLPLSSSFPSSSSSSTFSSPPFSSPPFSSSPSPYSIPTSDCSSSFFSSSLTLPEKDFHWGGSNPISIEDDGFFQFFNTPESLDTTVSSAATPSSEAFFFELFSSAKFDLLFQNNWDSSPDGLL